MKIKTSVFLALITCVGNIFLNGQSRTVGGLVNTSDAYEGYTLFSPAGSTSTFLVNNCGQLVHEWPSTKRPGNSVYLREDGSIFRAGNITPPFGAPGVGGIIEHISWEGELIWSFEYATEEVVQHHDFHVMPNGNVLILAWGVKSYEEAVAAGRNPETIVENEIWAEHLIEIKPIGENEGEVVWFWDSWDHLIQDFDETKENFGVVESNPQKIDLNYRDNDGADWHHINSVHYSEDNDLILLSSPFNNEFWIVDRNTTTEEASGALGDLVYRWGNPLCYGQGNESDQKLFFQHTVEWLPADVPDGGKIIIFNNGRGRTPDEYSSVVILDPYNSEGEFELSSGTYLPETFDWEYIAPIPTDFYASFISGAQRLPNGNTLINDGPIGTFFEINSSNEIVWKYVNPVTSTGQILNQGDPATGNLVFRATKYPSDFAAFNNKNLASIGFVEGNGTNLTTCQPLFSENSKLVKVYPNPFSSKIQIDGTPSKIEIYDLIGRKVSGSLETSNSGLILNLSHLENGTYILKLDNTIRLIQKSED